MLLILTLPAIAQERGQYIPGTGGLNSGLQTPEGITYANLFIWYPSTKFKDQFGNKAAINFDLDLLVDLNLVAYTTKAKFLGANYGNCTSVAGIWRPQSNSGRHRSFRVRQEFLATESAYDEETSRTAIRNLLRGVDSIFADDGAAQAHTDPQAEE